MYFDMEDPEHRRAISDATAWVGDDPEEIEDDEEVDIDHGPGPIITPEDMEEF